MMIMMIIIIITFRTKFFSTTRKHWSTKISSWLTLNRALLGKLEKHQQQKVSHFIVIDFQADKPVLHVNEAQRGVQLFEGELFVI